MASEAMRRYFTPENAGEDLANLGVVPVPPPDEKVESQESDFLAPFFRPVTEAEMPPEGIRRTLDEEQRLAPFFRRDTTPESLRRPAEVAPRLVARAVPVAKASVPAAPVAKAPEAQPIPVANASPTADAAAPVASALPSVGPQNPAGRPDSSGKDGMIAPSSEGAGGDAALGRLSLGQALTRALEGSGSIIAGRDLRSGAADTLGDRMKQIEALRAKREEQGITDTRERANNRAQVDYLISRFPDRAEDLQKLYGMTGKPNFSQMLRVEEQVALDKAKKATEEVKPDIALRGADVKEGTLEERITHNRATEALARAAAALAAERAARPAAEDRGVKPEALTNRLKDLNAQTKPFQEIVSSLREADAALSALGTGQISRGAKIASKIPLVGSSFVSTPELRAMQGQEGLKQSYQKLKTGLAAVGQELTSFENQFGLNWYADPRKAPLAVETLKQITQDALRRTQAPFGAGTGNPAIDQMEVLSLLKNTGGLTADNPIFQPNPKLEKAAGVISGPTGPTESQIAKLKARPDMATEFDKKFGPGAAAKILGGP